VSRVRLAACVILMLLAGCQAPSDRPTPGFKPSNGAAVVITATGQAVATLDPPPTTTPAPTPVPPTSEPPPLFVINTGADGLSLRPSPGSSDRVAVLLDGTRLTPTGEEVQSAGRTWVRVRDPEGREGWVAAQFTGPAPLAETRPPAIVPATPVPAPAVPKPAATAVPAPAKPGAPTAAPSKPVGPTAAPAQPTAAERATGTRAPSVLVATPRPKPAATAAATKPAVATAAPTRPAPR
jgi:hypothetical protein